ncbi:hypothetical protein Tco_0199493 [Tanacetum coccineum]
MKVKTEVVLLKHLRLWQTRPEAHEEGPDWMDSGKQLQSKCHRLIKQKDLWFYVSMKNIVTPLFVDHFLSDKQRDDRRNLKEAQYITKSLLKLPIIALQLRVARLEQEMSEVKKTDHSADVLASIKSQVPTAGHKRKPDSDDDETMMMLKAFSMDNRVGQPKRGDLFLQLLESAKLSRG